MVSFLVICLLTFVVFCIFVMTKSEENKNKLNETIRDEKHNKLFKNHITKSAILYNEVEESNKEIILVKDEEKQRLNYKDILQVELTEDSVSRTKTKRGSQIGGAALGGLIFGVAGSVVGGLSGQKEHEEKVRQIGLRFVVNDTDYPVREITLHNFGVLRDKDHEEYQKAYKESFEWYKLIEVLIHQADKEDEKQESTAN